MKIYLSNYRNHWISPYTILEYVFFWTDWSKCARYKNVVADEDYIDHPKWVDKATTYISPLSCAIKWVLNIVHPQISYVKIDRWDTWSMDYTLAHIILPMLKQLKDSKHGASMVDDEDVPEELRDVPNDDEQTKVHEKWEWVISEMIWAFEQKLNDAEEKFFDHSAYNQDNGKVDHDQWMKDMSNRVSKVKVDFDGLKLYQDRKANGYRLFGKYYEGLWD